MSQLCKTTIEVCQDAGLEFKKLGPELYARCPFHNDGKRPNFRVSIEKDTWFCDVCGEGGGPVEFVAKKTGRDKKEVFKELVVKEPEVAQPSMGRIVATYDYTDRLGKLLYQAVRYEPKTFKQRRPDGKGGWLWNLKDIERVLYHLPDVLKPENTNVWVVEGEKDVETLRKIGMAATCNVGGAGKWCDAYSDCLKDKNVIVCGDNDDAGRKHVLQVIESLETKAASIRVLELPGEVKDVTQFAETFPSTTEFEEALARVVMAGKVMVKGGSIPIKSMADLEREYMEDVENAKTRTISLSDWIPSLCCVRPLVAGELVAIVGDTGSAKTYILQHIALYCRVPTLLFELELPGSLTFERFVGLARQKEGREVHSIYDCKERLEYSDLDHIYTCTKSRITTDEMESIILKSELRIGVRPALVLVDYIQLIHGTTGKSRYEQISGVAEQLKIVAKNTRTVVVMASQVGRDKTTPEIRLHDAKDSGSIENSSGVVIGIWREPNKARELNLRVLKNTKGRPSDVIKCLILDGSMRIVEQAPDHEYQQ